MIRDVAQLKALKNLSQHLEAFESTERLSSREATSLLSKIQIGDLLQGELIVEGDQFFLKLDEDLKLLVNVSIDLIFNKKLNFCVIGKENGRLLLEYDSDKAHPNQSVGIVDQTLQELNLKDTPEMRQMIEHFVGKHLPLIKEQLVKFVNFTKSYTVPTEVITNLVSQNQMPKQDEIETLTLLKEQGIKTLLPSWHTFVETLTFDQSYELAKKLLSLLTPQQLEHSLQEAHLLQYEKQMDDSLSSLVHGTNSSSDLANLQMISSQDELFEQLNEVLKSASHNQLNELNKDFIKKYLILNINQISSQEKVEIQKITEMSTRLKQIMKSVKEVNLENGADVYLEGLEKNIEILDKYKMEGQYCCFPLQIKEQQVTGEFYFFKPKKHKLQQESGMYIVLALNMPALHKVEVHLVEQSNEMTLKIKVENESIKKQLQKYESILLEGMKEETISLKKIEVELLNKRQHKLEQFSNELRGLDLKI